MTLSLLPAGIGLSHLQVYTSVAPDGQRGGAPHMHLACTELYVVTHGTGAVEFLSVQAGYQRVDLAPGAAVQFTPGVLHRLINADQLEIIVVMQNAGLAEGGDVAFPFPHAVLTDAAYTAAATAHDLAGAERRRDLAVRGFGELLAAWRADPAIGRAYLLEFHRRAVARATARVPAWEKVVEARPARAVATTREHLAAIAGGVADHLADGAVTQLTTVDPAALKPRMCGWLWSWHAEGVSAPTILPTRPRVVPSQPSALSTQRSARRDHAGLLGPADG